MLCMQPRCTRCGAGNYSGEVNILGRTYSLCGYCLPVVEGKLIGFVNDHLSIHPDMDENSNTTHNVFRDEAKDL